MNKLIMMILVELGQSLRNYRRSFEEDNEVWQNGWCNDKSGARQNSGVRKLGAKESTEECLLACKTGKILQLAVNSTQICTLFTLRMLKTMLVMMMMMTMMESQMRIDRFTGTLFVENTNLRHISRIY